MTNDEFEIEWIPEDIGAPYTEIDMAKPETPEIPSHVIDKICKKKFGHTNWARMSQIGPDDLKGNPAEIDYPNGIIYFKHKNFI